jgi:hypothetical protein
VLAAFREYVNTGQLARDFDTFACEHPATCEYAEPIEITLVSNLDR